MAKTFGLVGNSFSFLFSPALMRLELVEGRGRTGKCRCRRGANCGKTLDRKGEITDWGGVVVAGIESTTCLPRYLIRHIGEIGLGKGT